MRVDWLSSKNGTAPSTGLHYPLGGADADADVRWMPDGPPHQTLAALDENGQAQIPGTPLPVPRVKAVPSQQGRRHERPLNASLPTNRGYSASANLYHLERAYMAETAPRRSKSSHGMFN